MASTTSYELDDRIAGDRIAVFKGRRADGVMVLMHQLTPGFDHSDVLKLGIAYMLRNPPANGGLILDLVELDGLTYLVTADKPDCLELDGWLTREVGHAFAAPPAAQPAAAIEGASLMGFTPFLGSIQSTSGTLSPPRTTRPPASKGPRPLASSQLKPWELLRRRSLPRKQMNGPSLRHQNPTPGREVLYRAVHQPPPRAGSSVACLLGGSPVSSDATRTRGACTVCNCSTEGGAGEDDSIYGNGISGCGGAVLAGDGDGSRNEIAERVPGIPARMTRPSTGCAHPFVSLG